MDHHEFSPSRLEQLRICPGSYIMQQGLPDATSDISAEGTLLHNAVATGDFTGLSDEQIEVVQQCIDFYKSFMKEGSTVLFEQAVEIKDPETGIVLTKGIIDCIVVIEPDVIVCIDWKFGYIPVNDVARNIQLASYSAGVMQLFNVSSVDAWVFQPRIHKKSHHLFTSESAICANIQAIITKTQISSSGSIHLFACEEACRYCKARLNCPAFRVKFQKLTASNGDYDLNHIPTLEKLYEASKGVKSFLSEIENAVKKVIEEKGRCGKYTFEFTKGSREVKDLNALYAAVKDYLTPQEFNDVCKVTLGKFETAVADKLVAEASATGEKLTKTEAKKRCYAMIADLITTGTPTKKIVEVA